MRCMQAQDGEDIREEHHERVERYREYGWDAVECENQVAELNEYPRKKKIWRYRR